MIGREMEKSGGLSVTEFMFSLPSPFVKKGQGGFRGACAGDRAIKIPLNPPFAKGEVF
jgi:hypothetical protein